MRGTVLFFNISRGFGHIKTKKDVRRYFVHQSEVIMDGLRALLPDMPVNFQVGNGPDGRLQAYKVKPDGFERFVNVPTPTINLEKSGVVPITIKGNTSFIVGGTRPGVASHTFSAYPVNGRVQGFRLEIPPYDGKSVWVVLDWERKAPVIKKDRFYDFCPVLSDLMRFTRDGRVVVFVMGHRHQKDNDGKNHNWVVIEERFRHQYDVSRPIMEQETPRTGGLERDNDLFIPALEVCRLFFASEESKQRQAAVK